MSLLLSRTAILFLAVTTSVAATADDASSTKTSEQAISFNQSVRPLLSDNCFACHGPDEENRQADLRLDVPGEIDFEEVARRIGSNDPDEVMPPPSSNKSLTASEITTLKRWIDDGAQYETHWAFVPPTRARLPESGHPIDLLIDRRLKAKGLTRSAPAAPAIRLRRLYLDLIGIPPTVEQADAFLKNPSDEAWRAEVNRLLASPRYGERWARRWLDLARYADTNGYEKDRDRTIWPYRDWVIRALNDDMPFDQFSIEQLAGDLLADPTPEQLVATGFHRNTMLNEEGGIDPLEFRFHAMTDRVATTGTTWLGLTTGCAQCHTHKYDPITHHDYFGMMAYLNNADEPDFIIPPEDETSAEQSIEKRIQSLKEALPGAWPKTPDTPKISEAMQEWITHEREQVVDWKTIVPETMSANTPYMIQEAEGVIFVGGDISKHDIYTLTFGGQKTPVTSIRLEALPDSRLPGSGPGLTYYEGRKGDFYLSEFELDTSSGRKIKLASASETWSKSNFGKADVTAAQAIDGDIQTGWGIGQGEGIRDVAVFNLSEAIPAGESFTIRMHFGRHYAASLGKFRLSVSDAGRQLKASSLTRDEQELIVRPDASDIPQIRQLFLMHSPRLLSKSREIRRLQVSRPGTKTLIMRERPTGQPRLTRRHHRGEYQQPREVVPPRLPEAIFPPEKTLPTNRLEFARWIVSAENPLTARVVVNRHWAAFFGTGIVATLDDFGMQGEVPSHPQLLDELALRFIDSGWSLKSLHRLIVTSETYQQNSRRGPQSSAANDRLLQRFPRTRLEAEIIRDSALAASGLLATKMFGPPVRPPQPTGAAANYTKSNWKPSTGADRYRRSIYTYQKRTAPFAMLTTFDATSGESCVANRGVSNTPLQALTLMNDPMFIEIAAAFGKKMSSQQTSLNDQLTFGFRSLLTRYPDSEELELLRDFHLKHRDWTATARVLMSLDEAVTK